MDREHEDWRPTGLQIKDKPPDDFYKGKKAVHEEKIVFCYQNCSDLMWEKIDLVIEKNFWNSRLKAENLNFFLRSLEQLIQTVKGENNFW